MGKYGGRRPTQFNDLAEHPDLQARLEQAKRDKDPEAAVKILDEAETRYLASVAIQIELVAQEAKASSAIEGITLDLQACRRTAAKAIASKVGFFSDWQDLLAALDGDDMARERLFGRDHGLSTDSTDRASR